MNRIIACLVMTLYPALITQAAVRTPFILVLPNGDELLACEPVFEVAPMKRFTFKECESIFIDGFEGVDAGGVILSDKYTHYSDRQ